jgi:glycerate kinase
MSAQRSNQSTGDTGTRDIAYDLVSVIYHSLQGAETTAMFIADAEQENNQDCAQFFREVKQQYEQRAQRAKQLLTTHLSQSQGKGAAGGGNK